MLRRDALRPLVLEDAFVDGLHAAGDVSVDPQGSRLGGVSRDTRVLADGETEPPAVDLDDRRRATRR